MDPLSSESLLPFLSSFDGWNQRFAWDLEREQQRREGSVVFYFATIKCEEEEAVAVVGEHMGIYTQVPMDMLRVPCSRCG
jgi:hypothetical protein